MLTKRQLRSTRNSASPKTIHFIEFRTALIKLFSQISQKQLSVQESFAALKKDKKLFVKQDDKSSQLLVNWSHRMGNRDLLIVIPDKQNEIHFSDDGGFLTIQIKDDELLIKQQKHDMWDETDIRDLVTQFSEILQAPKITFLSDKHHNETELKPIKSLTKSCLNDLLDQYQNTSVTYKINEIVLKNAKKNDNMFAFNFVWKDEKGRAYPLVVCLGRNKPYNSYFLDEESIYKLFYPTYKIDTGQYFYALYVFEPNNHIIIHDRFSSDGRFGELYQLERGNVKYAHENYLSGSENLKIHQFLARLFNPEKIFITDNAVLCGKKSFVPLRLMLGLTDKTFYESKLNAKIFKCSSLKTKYEGVVWQNERLFEMHGKQLKRLSLTEWHQMLVSERNRLLQKKAENLSPEEELSLRAPTILADLIHKYIDETQQKATLEDLAKKVFAASNQEKQKGPSEDLILFSQILCKGMEQDDKKIDPLSHDASVTDKVKTRLWRAGRFWYHTLPEEEKKESLTECKLRQSY